MICVERKIGYHLEDVVKILGVSPGQRTTQWPWFSELRALRVVPVHRWILQYAFFV